MQILILTHQQLRNLKTEGGEQTYGTENTHLAENDTDIGRGGKLYRDRHQQTS